VIVFILRILVNVKGKYDIDFIYLKMQLTDMEQKKKNYNEHGW
jgi:hypothetical protein